LSVDNRVNVRSEFVSYQRFGFTHIAVSVHFPSASQLRDDEWEAVDEFARACRKLDRVCLRFTADGDGSVSQTIAGSDGIDA